MVGYSPTSPIQLGGGLLERQVGISHQKSVEFSLWFLGGDHSATLLVNDEGPAIGGAFET